MGYSTRYLGYLTIDPPLNAAEASWLRCFTEWAGGPGGGEPYDVPDNPRAAWSAELAARREGSGQRFVVIEASADLPMGIGDWSVSSDGMMITWQEQEKSNDARQVIDFLIQHFLVPGAHAQRSARPQFDEFTFDHRVSGVIAAEHGGSGELFLLHVVDGEIRHETIVAGTNHEW